MELRQFILELRSRNVYRTAAVYLAGAWALLQVADVLFPVIGLPDWSITAVLILAGIGFPIALVLSWLFELTPESEVDRGEQPSVEGNLPAARIIELTLVLMLCGLVGYLYVGRLAPSSDTATPAAQITDTSIAVLPFVNLSDDKQMEYLGDGLAEEILNLLARLNELNVAARTSSFYFKGKDVDIPTVGQKLGVAHVLEGSVRISGERVRVTAQLIKSADGFHLWSQTYDRELIDVLAIQDDIAAKVVDQLQLLLSSESRDVLARSTRIDPRAYDYYLRGRSYLRSTPDESKVLFALELFDKAIVEDPEFAEAYAGKCDGLLELYRMRVESDTFRSAEKACEQALRLDRRAPAVYIALGSIYQTSGQYSQALDEYGLALSLGGMAAEAHLGMGNTYQAAGDFESAEASYLRALELQPGYWRALMAMAGFLLNTGRVEEAVPYYTRVSELMPDSEIAFNNLGVSYFILGDFQKASDAIRQSLALAPSALTYSNMATSLYLLERYDEALKLFHQAVELTPEAYEMWGNLGDTYRQIDDGDELAASMYSNAIRLLEKHLEINDADPDALALLAHYQAALGQDSESIETIGRVRKLPQDSFYVDYSLATAYVSLGNLDEAMDALGRSLQAGFPKHFAAADANLKPLRDRPEFRAMTEAGVTTR